MKYPQPIEVKNKHAVAVSNLPLAQAATENSKSSKAPKVQQNSQNPQNPIIASNEPNDIIDFPLPEIPSKKKLLKGKSLSRENLLNTIKQQFSSKPKDSKNKMHYRNASNEKPTYLFGESTKKGDETSRASCAGWLKMAQNQRFDKYLDSRKENINTMKLNSKIEELITRNEARKVGAQISFSKEDNVTILKIDPQNHHLGDRPGFLPVKNNISSNAPPPTPILSPPPAFQVN